ncbi:hypothetical protein HmCmsJML033_04500 [Escherichia coli]|nr:hypothetical protein HmCmsJML033_04500 [Escherichia coli]
MENEGDNIITLVQPKRDEEKLLNITVTGRKNYTQQSCKHRAIEVHEQDRVILCYLLPASSVKKRTPKHGCGQQELQYCMRKMTLKILSRR